MATPIGPNPSLLRVAAPAAPGATRPTTAPPSTETPLPADGVQLSRAPRAERSAAAAKSSSWLRRTGLALATLGLGIGGGAMLGGAMAPALSAAAGPPPQAQVRTTTAPVARPTAPVTLFQEAPHTVSPESVKFDVLPHTLESLGTDKAQVQSFPDTDSKPNPKGGRLTYEHTIDRLMSSEGRALYSSEQAELMAFDFHDGAASNWSLTSTLKPAGHFGPFVSVAEHTVTHAEESGETSLLRTIDTRTGNVANLTDLLSADDYEKVAEAVQERTNTPETQKYHSDSLETLDSFLNNGFSLNNAKDGGVILRVAMPNQQNPDGKVAEFVFRLPASSIRQ